MAGKRRKQEVANSITKRPNCLATEEESRRLLFSGGELLFQNADAL